MLVRGGVRGMLVRTCGSVSVLCAAAEEPPSWVAATAVGQGVCEQHGGVPRPRASGVLAANGNAKNPPLRLPAFRQTSLLLPPCYPPLHTLLGKQPSFLPACHLLLDAWHAAVSGVRSRVLLLNSYRTDFV